MEKIQFKTGFKEFQINDDENAVIRVNLTDTKIMERIKKAQENLEATLKKYEAMKDKQLSDDEAIEITDELEKEIRTQINYIFNSDVSTMAFGTSSCFSYEDGLPVFVHFLNAILPRIKKQFETEKKKSEKNIKKYTSQVRK